MTVPMTPRAPASERRKFRRCAICRWPKFTVLIPVHPAPPPDVALVLGLREREEPWCLSCAAKVLNRAGDNEYIWRSAAEGWPT